MGIEKNLLGLSYLAQAYYFLVHLSEVIIILVISHWIFNFQTVDKVFFYENHLLAINAIIFQQILFVVCDVYQNLVSGNLKRYFSRLIFSWTVVFILLSIILLFSNSNEYVSFSQLIPWYFTCLILFSVIHFSLRYIFLNTAKVSPKRQTIILFGAGDASEKIVETLSNNHFNEFYVEAIFDDNQDRISTNFPNVSLNGSLSEGLDYINQYSASSNDTAEIWISLPMRRGRFIEALLDALQKTTFSVHYVPDLTGVNLLNSRIQNFHDFNVFTLIDSPFNGTGLVSKALQDKLLAFILLILFAPVLLIIAILIKVDSPGPVFFKQKRYGIDNKQILVWKFRSMYNYEDMDLQRVSLYDKRVTKVGRFIRKTSLDELPQLFNVLSGGMSLVGPRPHAVVHNEEYRDKIKGYMLRHKLKPGVTGWAQVNGWRGETDELSQIEKRIEYDLYYIRNWSTLLDFKILFMTLKYFFVTDDLYEEEEA